MQEEQGTLSNLTASRAQEDIPMASLAWNQTDSQQPKRPDLDKKKIVGIRMLKTRRAADLVDQEIQRIARIATEDPETQLTTSTT